jgi:hypothetical protein
MNVGMFPPSNFGNTDAEGEINYTYAVDPLENKFSFFLVPY